jgi:hypothetical protein
MLDFLRDRVATWWLPDDVAFVDELPHTATGKLHKLRLREQFKDYRLPRPGWQAAVPGCWRPWRSRWTRDALPHSLAHAHRARR